jgi:NAD(P)-dependent dehydrogenase (short-subunit alcohol dehydrogenase family)
MGVNLDGVVFGVHAAIPALQRRGGGSIVATASMAGLTGTPFDPVYGANKHAVVGLVRALGPALAPRGIRVNALLPELRRDKIIGNIPDLPPQQRRADHPGRDAGDAVLAAFDSSETGQAWLLQAGRDVMVYRFRGLPGPLDADGNPARPADPAGVVEAPPASAEPPA